MLKIIRIASLALLAAFTASAAFCETKFVDVTVSHNERIALPGNARLHVEIQDVSGARPTPLVLSYVAVNLPETPFTVRIGVDASLVVDGHSYGVGGIITSGDEVIFRSTSAVPVLADGSLNSVDLSLVRADSPETGAIPGNPLAGIPWEMFELGGRMFVIDDLPTIVFDRDGRFALYAGCNRYTGMAEITDSTIELTDEMAGTQMACTGMRDDLEKNVLETLSQVTGHDRNGGLLALTNPLGEAVARFRQRPE